MITPVSSEKKVARVVTSYGHWHYIARWMDNAALQQPFVQWIFVNDKPSDPLPAALRPRLERLGQVIEAPVNMGRSCARNLGVNRAAATWVDIIDGDDIPRALDENFDAAADDSGLIFFAVHHHRDAGAGTIKAEIEPAWRPSPLNELIESLIGHYDCRPAAVLWKREVFLTLGGFDGRADFVEDLNLCVRARLAGIPFSKVPHVKASYQRDTPGRLTPPILAVANLSTWELARPLAQGSQREALEEQIRFFRRAVLWAGMNESEKNGSGFLGKIAECAKWIFPRPPRSGS